MARERDGGNSFDPRTWGGSGGGPGRAASPPPPPPGRAAGTKAAPPPPRPSAAVSSKPPPGLSRTGPLVAFGISALLLIVGAFAAHFLRSVGPAPTASATDMPTVAAPAPTGPENASRRTLVVASAADIAAALSTAGAPKEVAAGAGQEAVGALGGKPGDIRLVIDLIGPDTAREMTRLEATRDDGSGIVLTLRPDGSYGSETRQARLTTQVRVIRGEMDSTSFYNSAVTAGVIDSLIEPFAKAFSFDFNFATDIHPGDVFEAAFEQQVNPQGQAVGTPTLVYASMQTEQKSKSLYRFLAPGDTEPGWFDGNGRSTVTALMRTPVDGARISSGFGMRFHPVLHFNKLHKGTDFAAPIGTAIYAAGTGVIQWAAMKGPNGNLTILQHDNGWQTYYLHQSMFMPGVIAGARVTQGQKIGEIGTTGRSTGPHLHFELHVDGQPIDPMSIETGTGRVLIADALVAFKKERDRIDASRATAAT